MIQRLYQNLLLRNFTFLLTVLLGLSFLQLTSSLKQTPLPSSSSPKDSPQDKEKKEKVHEIYKNLPLFFIPNKGQLDKLDKEVLYYAQGVGYHFYLTNEGVSYSFVKNDFPKTKGPSPLKENLKEKEDFTEARGKETFDLKVKFVGANKDAFLSGQKEQEGKVNYFMGNDPSKWQTNLSTFSQITYKNLYEGIDLTYKGDQRKIKYEFVVAPAANYKDIKMSYRGANSLKLDEKGNLLINTPWGSLKDEKPYIYQLVDGKKLPIEASFTVKNDIVGFSLGSYNPYFPLIIDPGLLYSTFLGGKNIDGGNAISNIAVDSAGNAYIVGNTNSLDFPTTAGAFAATYTGGEYDIFITKVNASGSTLLYSTYFGGSMEERGPYGIGIAVDGSGNVYITGLTNSPDFPTTSGALDTTFNGGVDVFYAKLNASGSSLLYSTFLGGVRGDGGLGISLDASGDVYLVGETTSPDFPITPGAFDTSRDNWNVYEDIFVTKINASGSSLLYSTFIGGGYTDNIRDIAVDASGNVYLTGFTLSFNFPTTPGAFDTKYNGGWDAFVTKLNASGSSLLYSTFLGGSSYQNETGKGIVIDANGNAYLTGWTASVDFPTTPGVFDTSFNGEYDVFVVKLNPTGSGLVYSTFIGGSGSDGGYDIALDRNKGNVYLTGNTGSFNFPTTQGSFDTTFNGHYVDVFVVKLNSLGSDLLYSTYLGGIYDETGEGIALDNDGNAYLTGSTNSSDFPTTPGAFYTVYNGGSKDIFVAKLEPVAFVNRPPVAEAGGPYVGSEGSAITFDGTGSYDPDGTIVSYEWDLDGDGAYGDAIGTNPSYTWADDYSGPVSLKVTDDKGVQSTDTAQVTVNNVAPSVNIDSVSQPNPIFILPHHNLTFTGSFTDVGWLDTHLAAWDFGDGNIIPGPLTEENVYPDSTGASTVTHSYLVPGTYTVTLTITDDDGGEGKATTLVKVLSATESVAAINNYIQALPDSAFVNNPDQRKNAFAQKLAEVQALINAGLYEDAINKLQNDILMKVDGFIDNKPDLDWVIDEPAQRDLYYAILELVSYLQTL